MKKALFSLLLAIACMPVAFGQNKGRMVITDTTVCGKLTWINDETYVRDTIVMYTQDSTTYVLNLTMRAPSYDTLRIAHQDTGVCSVTWNRKEWKEAGIFFDTLTAVNGCDSIIKIEITLGGTDTINNTVTQCDRYIAPWGDTLTASTVISDSTIPSAFSSCFYFTNLNLTINHSVTMPTEVIPMADCSYSWHRHTITDTMLYCDTLKSSLRCDSIVSLRVAHFTNQIFDTTTQVACDKYVFFDDTLTASGLYTHIDSTTSCHSYSTVDLTIINSFRDTASTVISEITGGCRVYWLGETYGYEYLNDTIYGMSKTAVGNCDSLIAIKITSFDSVQHDTTFVNNCGKYTWSVNRTEYATDTVVVVTDSSASCIDNKVLVLNIIDNYDTVRASSCESYTYVFQDRAGTAGGRDRARYTESGTYTVDENGDTLYSTDRNTRCRTYHTLVLFVKEVDQLSRRDDVIDTACDTYTYSFNGQNNLRFTQSVDTVLKASVRYDKDYCFDSLAHFIITIKNKTYKDYNETACDSYLWPFTNRTYTTSTVETKVLDSIKNSVGCDSVGRLNLTINYTPEVSIVGNWHLHTDSSNVATLKVADDPADHNTYKWFKNSETTPFSTSDSVSITVTDNTDIRLEATSNKNCTATNWITITYTTGIDDVESLHVNLYPNPASRYLNVESANGLSEVIVYNALGQQVVERHNINGNTVQLDLGNLATGNYTMMIRSLNGEQATRKFIVNK